MREKRRKYHRWYKLDNAAIIVPCSVRGADTRVFRLVCELKEPVDPKLLQRALDEIIPEFAYLNSILRKGLFWYYLDSVEETVRVQRDEGPAIARIWYPGSRKLMYRVTWFDCRINLEMFHVLADGTGAFIFFRRLVATYLAMKTGIPVPEIPGESSSQGEKTADAFAHYYARQRKTKAQWRQMSSAKAYQIHDLRDPTLRNHLMEGVTSASAFVAVAHQYKATVGVFATALYIAAVLDDMSLKERKKPVIISVPVNLRQFFPSETTRNFFGTINISYQGEQGENTLPEIIASVSRAFHEQLAPEAVRETMNSYSDLVQNYVIKAVPLFVKEPVLSFFLARTHSGVTATISNLERIRMPEEIADEIDHFAAFMSAPSMQVTMASYRDKLVFGSAGAYTESTVMLNFYRRLTGFGLKVDLATNDYDVQPDLPRSGEKRVGKIRGVKGKRNLCSTVQNAK